MNFEDICKICRENPTLFESYHYSILQGGFDLNEYLNTLITRCYPNFVSIAKIQELVVRGAEIKPQVVTRACIMSPEFLKYAFDFNLIQDKDELLWQFFNNTCDFDGLIVNRNTNSRIENHFHSQISKILAEGANPNHKNESGISVIQKALEFPEFFQRSINLLLESGAGID